MRSCGWQPLSSEKAKTSTRKRKCSYKLVFLRYNVQYSFTSNEQKSTTFWDWVHDSDNTYQFVGAQLPARVLEIKRGSINLDVRVIWHCCCAVEWISVSLVAHCKNLLRLTSSSIQMVPNLFSCTIGACLWMCLVSPTCMANQLEDAKLQWQGSQNYLWLYSWLTRVHLNVSKTFLMCCNAFCSFVPDCIT